ncbi:MAG: hypothetical protein AB7O73_05925, partial [Bacteroidia bacterium]
MKANKLYILTFFLVIALTSSGRIDSLKKVIRNVNMIDSNRIDAVNHLIYDLSADQIDTAYEYMFLSEKLIASSKLLNKDRHFGQLYAYMAIYQVKKLNDFSNGMRYSKLAIEHLEKTKEYGNLANAYSFLAREIFERMEMIDEAVVYLKNSIYTHQIEIGFSVDFPYYVVGWLET